MTNETNKLSDEGILIIDFCKKNNYSAEDSLAFFVLLSLKNSKPKESTHEFLKICEQKNLIDFSDCLSLAVDIYDKYNTSERIAKD
jgi:hypothetical protein